MFQNNYNIVFVAFLLLLISCDQIQCVTKMHVPFINAVFN